MDSSSQDPVTRPRRFPEVERREASANPLELEPLMTVCPKCGTRFRVTENQLQAARGWVRCGACSAVFDGVDQLVLDAPLEYASAQDALQALDDLMAELMVDSRVVSGRAEPAQASEPESLSGPAAAAGLEPEVEAADTGPAAGPHGSTVVPAWAPAAVAAEEITLEAAPPPATPGPQDAGPGEESPPRTTAPAPPAVVFGRQRPRTRVWLWLLVPLAVLAIAAQVLWLQFDTLVRDPSWRPVYAELCGWIGCDLPVRRAVDRIRTRSLRVQANPDGTPTLQVRAVVVNEADFVQPFPTLELRFSALNGMLIAGHRFLPGQYLAGDARNLDLMPVGTPVQLELTIPDPGEHAVNYQLDLK